MEERSTYGYIYIGTAIRYLVDATPGYPVFGIGRIEGNIQELRRLLEKYEFFVSLNLSAELQDLYSEWAKELEEAEDPEALKDERTLTADESTRLRNAARSLRDTMLAEAAGKKAFIAADDRYSVEKLLHDVGSLMSKGVFDTLPDLAKYDFGQAGRAIAFNLPTAAAFHLLRGVEAVLRDFYERLVRQKRIPEPRMWARITAALGAMRKPPPAVLLANLDSLRANFRNPTQHPEKVYDMDEAQDLLALSFDVVGRMSKYLNEQGR